MVTSAPLTTCPACPCRAAEQLVGRDALLAEVEALWAFRLRRLRPAVPIAGLVDRLVFTQPPPHGVLRCCACGTLRREPAECGIGEAYARDALCASALPRLSRLGRAVLAARVERLTALLGRPGAGLEVGPYAGAFYAALRPRLRGRAAPLARALLAHSNLLGFPYRHAFGIDALTGLLRAYGFRIARTLGDALVPLADEWTPAWAAVAAAGLDVVAEREPVVDAAAAARRPAWRERLGEPALMIFGAVKRG